MSLVQDGESCDQLRSVSTGVECLFEVSWHCPERPYIELQVPLNMKSIQAVIFKTVSHDQGFSGEEAAYKGTYEQSYTWFDAVVLNSVGHDRVPRKLLQRNVHASLEFREHEVRWGVEDGDLSIRTWLLDIKPGDTIQIVPKAQFPAWVNFVQRAEIELSFIEEDDSMSSTQTVQEKEASGSLELRNNLYRKLNEEIKEIRLINLHPGSAEDPVICSLMHASLQDGNHINYECLSYCWGDQKFSSNITVLCPAPPSKTGHHTVQEQLLPITSSLYSAMKNLRPKDGPPRTLWIDAICINQSDLDERSKQVAVMKEIYSMADNVAVWLGEGDESTTRCIQIINAIAERYENSPDDNPSSQSATDTHEKLFKERSVNYFLDEWKLFEMPWFKRTWVVQEIFNAKNATVHCGQEVLTWQMALRVNKCIRERCSGWIKMRIYSVYNVVMPPLFNNLFAYKENEPSTKPNGILDILIKGLDLDATDPRDKIFAMFQFGEETKQSDLLPPEILPNYRKTTVEVFSAFTRWWIVKNRSLRILSALHAEYGRTWQEMSCIGSSSTPLQEERPSWSLWYRGHSNWAESTLGLSSGFSYHASADTVPDIEMINKSQGTGNLPLVGIRISTIESVSPYPYHDPHFAEYQDLRDAYDYIYDPLNDSGNWIRSLYSQDKKPNTSGDSRSHEVQHFYSHLEYSRATGAIQCRSDCFFKATDELVGLCPPFVKAGDLVVVLYGGNVPYILRSRKGDGMVDGEEIPKYEFVGECFLHGYMEGQAIKEVEEKKRSTEVFELI